MFPLFALAGNPVKIRDGPAAVSEDEHRWLPLCCMLLGETVWEGAMSRVIHEPEYLQDKPEPPGEMVNHWADIYVGLELFQGRHL